MLDLVQTQLARQSPLAAATPFGDTAVVAPGPMFARFALRGPAAPFGEALGMPMPAAIGGTTQADGCACLRLGPDEILLLAPEAAPGLAALAAWDGPGAATDIGHRQTALRVSGPAAAALLNAGCPLDLHPSEFPAGRCTRTLLGKAEIILWRQDAGFHVEVARSFAAYAWDFLREASRG